MVTILLSARPYESTIHAVGAGEGCGAADVEFARASTHNGEGRLEPTHPVMPDKPVTVHRLRLRLPDLVFHVDVTLTEHEGPWLATAVLADEPDYRDGQ